MDDKLVAKMKEVDAEEMEERLDPELQRELCLAVLCERMDTRNYLWEEYYDESGKAVRRNYEPKGKCYDIFYDPKLATEFIFSGKEQFRAFMDFCKSVKTLKISENFLQFCLDKEVCHTESDPIYKPNQKMFYSEECFFIQTLLKYVKCLELFRYSDIFVESLYPYLSKMQRLEELIIHEDSADVDQLCKLLEKKPMTSIEAELGLFLKSDKVVSKCKLQKMVITRCYDLENVFKLSNFFPIELHLAFNKVFSDCKSVLVSPAFAVTKKLTMNAFLYHELKSASTLRVRMIKALSSADDFIGLLSRHFPNLEELCFEYRELNIDLNEMNQWKEVGDLCSDFVKKYQQKLDVKFVFVWKEDYKGLATHELMKKHFPGQRYEVAKVGGSTEYKWKNRISLNRNFVLDYDVCCVNFA